MPGDERWHGGYYELALELGPRDDARLDAAIRACWSAPSLTASEAPTLAAHERTGHLRGVATIPRFGTTVCGTVLVREDEPEIDWLDFYLPIGGLTDVDPRADSLWDGDSRVPYGWREPLDDYLAATAERVADAVTFELGIIGYEVSGTVHRRDLEDPVAPRGAIALLVPDAGTLRRIGP